MEWETRLLRQFFPPRQTPITAPATPVRLTNDSSSRVAGHSTFLAGHRPASSFAPEKTSGRWGRAKVKT
jgi:hypothetical protein